MNVDDHPEFARFAELAGTGADQGGGRPPDGAADRGGTLRRIREEIRRVRERPEWARAMVEEVRDLRAALDALRLGRALRAANDLDRALFWLDRAAAVEVAGAEEEAAEVRLLMFTGRSALPALPAFEDAGRPILASFFTDGWVGADALRVPEVVRQPRGAAALPASGPGYTPRARAAPSGGGFARAGERLSSAVGALRAECDGPATPERPGWRQAATTFVDGLAGLVERVGETMSTAPEAVPELLARLNQDTFALLDGIPELGRRAAAHAGRPRGPLIFAFLVPDAAPRPAVTGPPGSELAEYSPWQGQLGHRGPSGVRLVPPYRALVDRVLACCDASLGDEAGSYEAATAMGDLAVQAGLIASLGTCTYLSGMSDYLVVGAHNSRLGWVTWPARAENGIGSWLRAGYRAGDRWRGAEPIRRGARAGMWWTPLLQAIASPPQPSWNLTGGDLLELLMLTTETSGPDARRRIERTVCARMLYDPVDADLVQLIIHGETTTQTTVRLHTLIELTGQPAARLVLPTAPGRFPPPDRQTVSLPVPLDSGGAGERSVIDVPAAGLRRFVGRARSMRTPAITDCGQRDAVPSHRAG